MFIIIIIIYVSVGGQFDVIWNNCKPVVDGVVSTFEATMYTENMSICDTIPVTKVTFQVIYRAETQDSLCNRVLSTCDTNWNAQGCRCTGKSEEAYTFAFNFTFQRSIHEGSTLILQPDCVSSKKGLTMQPCVLEEGNTRHVSVAVTLYSCLCVFSLSTVARMRAFENKSSKVTFRSGFTTSRVSCLFVRSYIAVSKAKLAENVHIVLSSSY